MSAAMIDTPPINAATENAVLSLTTTPLETDGPSPSSRASAASLD